jgi:hypothetical protein
MTNAPEIYRFDQRDDLEPLVRQKLNENFRRIQSRLADQDGTDKYLYENAGVKSYTQLQDLPTIEGTTIVGDLMLPDINSNKLTDDEIDDILDCDCSGYWDDDAMDIYLAQVAELIADAGMLPAGGLADQVLTKVNGDDFNTYWADPPEGDDDEPISNLEIDAILTLSDLGD